MRSFIWSYLIPITLFLGGYHLHAQVEEWPPLWRSTYQHEDPFENEVKHPSDQMTTARWLMTLGVTIGAAAHFSRKAKDQ